MAKRTDIIKERLLDEILSVSEIETVMNDLGYTLIGTEDNEEKNEAGELVPIKIVKFSHTEYKADIWIKGETDNAEMVLVKDCNLVTKQKGTKTQVHPFHTYEDYEAVEAYFRRNNQQEYLLCAGLCVSLGRRVGDVLQLKWSDLFYKEGAYRERLTMLKEEKTGKIVAPVLNALAQQYIEEYCNMEHIKPLEQYTEQVFPKGKKIYESFRLALKQAVTEAGINYPIGSHSFRKFYANTLYKLHPQDAHSLEYIQRILGHSDKETTKLYIGEIDRKIDQYNADFTEYVLNKRQGIETEVSNSPILSIRASDFRELLGKCWELANNGVDKFEVVNQIIGETEQKVV